MSVYQSFNYPETMVLVQHIQQSVYIVRLQGVGVGRERRKVGRHLAIQI